jgi:predicted amidohydrolase
VLSAPTHDEGLFLATIDPAAVRRERIATPLLRDERPEFVLRQLDRITRDRQEPVGRAVEDD